MPVRKYFSSKRVRFIFVSLVLTLGMVLLSQTSSCRSLWSPPLLSLLALFLVNQSLGGTSGVEKITLLCLPFSLTLGAGFAQYFFPNFILPVKALGWLVYFLSVYAALLSLNIYKVVRLKKESIPLERIARPTLMILSFLASFLLLTAVYKLSLEVWGEVLLVFVVGFFLGTAFLWTHRLADLLEKEHLQGGLLIGLSLIQVSLALSFYPWEAFLRGLTEATFFYALLGVARAYFERHLKYRIAFEYVALSLAVFLIARLL
jgi:hypothetical protein